MNYLRIQMKTVSTVLLILIHVHLQSQVFPDEFTQDSSNVFKLGEVTVTAEDGSDLMKSGTMGNGPQDDLASVVSMLPGISLVNIGNRAESSILIRGFDLRSTPVYFDGIPVYLPYDGYLDLSRISSSRAAGISVSRGYTPIAFGSGALGGAVNIVSWKPKEKLEAEASFGYGSGNRRNAMLQLGSNLGKVYFSGHLNAVNQDFYALSSEFDTMGIFGSEDGGSRDNSYYTRYSMGVKAGYTPNDFDEYSLNFLYHSSEKGTPPYAGSDPQQRERFWQWPTWKKKSLYFIAKKQTGANSYLKLRAFYDDFSNQLSSYDDNSYITQSRRYAFNSYYDDFSIGINGAYNYSGFRNNHLKVFLQVKDDHHSEYNEGEPARDFRDLTYSTAIENSYRFNGKLRLLGSISYARREGILAEDYHPDDSSIVSFPGSNAAGFSYQAATVFKPISGQELRVGIYDRIRFSTMKERYSYRIGFGIPNPDLLPERARQAEISYTGKWTDRYSVQASIFYARMKVAIIAVYDTTTQLTQPQNTGEAQSYGFEASGKMKFREFAGVAFEYTRLKKKNITEPDIYFTDLPEHEIHGKLEFFPIPSFDISAVLRYMSDRYSTTYGTIAGSFYTIDLEAIFRITPQISVSLFINNLLDRNYALAEGYPEAGRMFFGALIFKL